MMGKHQTREEIWDGYAPTPAPKKPEAAKKAEPAPVVVAPEPAPVAAPVEEPKAPAPILKNLSRDTIAETFRTFAAQARAENEAFAPTLAALSALVSKCQDAGLSQIGLEQTSFDTLRQFKLFKDGASERAPHAHYAILSIDDARILVRVLPEKVIDCYNENINKPHSQPRYLDSAQFWNATDSEGKSAFRRFDLSKDADQIEFVQTLLITAAATGALQELRQYDAPAATGDKVAKPRAGGLKP